LPTFATQFRAQQWLILIVAVISVAITASLGAWQLRRAAFKEQLVSQIAQRNTLPALENNALNASNFIAASRNDDSWLQRRATLSGRWLPEHTVFLDNRAMHVSGSQRVGFYVVTPLALESDGVMANRVIWVQRGWVQRDFQDRSKLPALDETKGLVTVQGRLMANVSRAYDMQSKATKAEASADADASRLQSSAASASAGPSRIWQNLPYVDFESKALLPLALLQTEPETEINGRVKEDMLKRDWPAADTGVAKHYGYAFQWFALSVLLVILYVWFQIISPIRKRRKSEQHRV
jgi:cytochrome oxidase assembly protein ShyY1